MLDIVPAGPVVNMPPEVYICAPEVGTTPSGHVVEAAAGLQGGAWRAQGNDEAEAVAAARAARLGVRGLRDFGRRRRPPALVRGYGAASVAQLPDATRRLAAVLRRVRRKR